MYMAAEVLGFGKTDPAAIYNLTDAQLEQVKQKLIALETEYPQALDHRWGADEPVSES